MLKKCYTKKIQILLGISERKRIWGHSLCLSHKGYFIPRRRYIYICPRVHLVSLNISSKMKFSIRCLSNFTPKTKKPLTFGIFGIYAICFGMFISTLEIWRYLLKVLNKIIVKTFVNYFTFLELFLLVFSFFAFARMWEGTPGGLSS